MPPPHSYTVDYGYYLMVIGDQVVRGTRPARLGRGVESASR